MMTRLRALAKAPGFSALVVTILALGIGLSSALFSIVDAILLQPLHIDAAGRIVAIHTAWPKKGQVSTRVSGGDFLDLRAAAKSFSAIATYAGGQMGVQIGRVTRFARVFQTDPWFFPVLNIRAITGRLPAGGDGSAQTAVVSASFAVANWGKAEAGRTLRVDNRPYTVIGIIDDRDAFPEGAQIWTTGPSTPENQNHTAFNYRAIARLRPGVSLAQGAAELTRIREQDRQFRILALRDEVAGPARTTLLFLFGATALLLLIACGNVANLILARTSQRNRDTAICMSMGASVRQLFGLIAYESLILGAIATVLGILIAYGTLHLLYPFFAKFLPRSTEVLQLQPAVLLFASLACCFTVLACSIVPSLHLRTVAVSEVLKRNSGRGIVGTGQRTRQAIVVAQVALSCLLCVGAALLSRSLLALNQARLGFEPGNVTVMYADAPAFELPEYQRAIQTFETAVGNVRAMPGVRSAAAIMGLPTGQYGSNGSYWAEGVDIHPGQDPFTTDWTGHGLPHANFSVATSGYFKTLGIPLLAGRDFSDHDTFDRPFTAIVSASLAQHSFGASNPIGKRIYCGLDSPKPMTIVGVVGDVRQDSPASPLEPAIYMPLRQHPYYANEVEVVVRSEGAPHNLIASLRQMMERQAPGVAIDFATLPEMVDNSVAAPRVRAILSVLFASLAGMLAVAGIYALMLFQVNQQRSEIGLRMALGATPFSILRWVLRRAFALCAAGLLLGLAGAAALSSFASSLVYGIKVMDPLTYLLGATVVLALVFIAAAGPAWRASKVDPFVAIRDD